MLEGLVITDKKGKKYRLVLIKDDAVMPNTDKGSSASSNPVFGKWLKQERLRLKLTQKKLAQTSGILQPNIVAIEKGRRDPEPSTRDALTAALKKLSP
jgi:DNA-binding XRE family transcriptional regulator